MNGLEGTHKTKTSLGREIILVGAREDGGLDQSEWQWNWVLDLFWRYKEWWHGLKNGEVGEFEETIKSSVFGHFMFKIPHRHPTIRFQSRNYM